MIRWQLPRVRLWLGDSYWRYVAHGLLKVPGGNIAAGTLFVTWRWVA
jgi:hypothetical protein